MSAPSPATRTVSPADLGALLFLGAVWGGAFLFLGIAAPEVGPAWAAAARLGIGAAVLVAFAGPRTLAVARGRIPEFLVLGALFAAVPWTLIGVATLTLPTGFAALLNAATPLFTALFGVAVLGQRLGRGAIGGLIVGVAAVLVLVGWSPLAVGPGTLLAVAAGLGVPASYAAAGTWARARLDDIHGMELATGMLVGGFVVQLPIAALSGAPGTPTLAGIASLVAVGLVSTAAAWPVYFRLLGRTTPMAASTVTFIVPAFAIAWGAIFLGEAVGLGLVAGFALVLVSLLLVLGIRPPLPVLSTRRRPAVATA